MGKKGGKHSSDDNLSPESDVSSDFIIIDPRPKTNMDIFVEQIFGDITKSSACKQLAIGGATGWATGYLANKIGKLAAVSLAGSLLIFQVAQYNGFITVDWTKVRHAVTKAEARVRTSQLKRRQSLLEKIMMKLSQSFYEENFFLATGFGAGFLIGFIW